MSVPGFGASAAPVLNVTAKVERLPEAQQPGKLEIFAAIPENFKIYSISQEPGGPFPTRIHLPKEVQLIGEIVSAPAPHAEKDPDVWGEMTIESHKSSVKWTVEFTWQDASAVPAQITGSVEAQMCDPNSCLPPKKFPFTVPVPVAVKSETSAISEFPVMETESVPSTSAPSTSAPSTSSEPSAAENSVPVSDENGSQVPESKEPKPLFAPTLEAGSDPFAGRADEGETDSGTAESTEVSVPLKPAESSGQESELNAALEAAQSLTSGEPETIQSLEWDGGTASPNHSLAVLLIMAYLGGLILNLMPCVLPVIAPKLHSFVRQAGEARGRIFLLNVSYTLGLLTVLWLLASLSRISELIAFLRTILPEGAASRLPEIQSMGWGQQFTYPGFVIFMIALVFVMGLSFLGVWEIPIPGMISGGKLGKMQRKEGFLGAYCMGILTTLLATPCVGPYLGPVFGWVITQPVWMSFLVFTVIGLGLGTPYLTIGAFPVLIRFLPKPGEWMETLKEVMGFFFLGTVVWLFYVLPARFTVPTLGLLASLWFACWLIGKVTLSGASREAQMTAWAAGILVSAFTGFMLFSLDLEPHGVFVSEETGSSAAVLTQVSEDGTDGSSPAIPVSAESIQDGKIPWQTFSDAMVEQARQKNQIVFIDFTARWCATCQTNSKFAIQTLKVNQYLQSHGIVPLLADWTEPSEEIENYLKRMGRRSIPLIVIWIPGQERPILVDGLVSESKILSALEFAVKTSQAGSSSESLPGARAVPLP